MPITVGIADLKAGKAPDVIVTYALGSCVGICLYDASTKVGGLAHIMLPLSTEAAAYTADNKYRYADTGIAELITLMERKGASKTRMTAKIAGGAQMFSSNSAVFNIGERNVIAVRQILAKNGIRIAAQAVGSNYGRTVFFHTDKGTMEVRAATKPTQMM
ncbi:MAG: chemotaxis protein CheD [Oscillospiraceae bacterium]|nr:chemotaxis protein CheD [Oscillospiraceae bacterium]